MKFVVDKNIPLAEKAFASLGEVSLLETGTFTNESVRDADVIVVRSETKVNKTLLDGSRVKFVGTATIGTDHIDLDYLNSQGIAFASAPGCNSNSVKEYVVAALLYLSVTQGCSLKGKTIGVVGVGNVGSKVVKAAKALGMTVLQNDPPRARAENNSAFLPLDDLMQADIITLHVPLTKTGIDATYHLFDEERIFKMKPGTIFINTARGAVVDTTSLKKAISNKHISSTVIDVWENEPDIDTELLSMVTIGTPHIAGYSLEGKTNAISIIRSAVCKHFNIDSVWNHLDELSKPEITDIKVSVEDDSIEKILHDIVCYCYNISYDNDKLFGMLTILKSYRPDYFRKLRTMYRTRHEFGNYTVHLPLHHNSIKEILLELGFKCEIYK